MMRLARWGLLVLGVVITWPWHKCSLCGADVWMPGRGMERRFLIQR